MQQRLTHFGARTTRVAKMLPTVEDRYISQQLIRSGLSGRQTTLKPESPSWLEQIVANGLFSRDKMAAIIAENQELCWIVAASIKTARRPGGPI